MSSKDKLIRVLIVEDDREISSVIAMAVADLGIETEQVFDGKSGLNKARTGDFDLIVLDIMLPQLDGISVCTAIREKDPYTPILMLTAKSEEIDRVLGLELGADDYMPKPFSLRELIARIKALLRRSQAGMDPSADPALDLVNIGGLMMDFNKRKVTLDGNTVELTVKEFDLLAVFAKNPGRAYSRCDLLNIVWGYQFQGYEHTVNTHINRLRNKIEADPSHPRYLLTVWGMGYRFAETVEVSP